MVHFKDSLKYFKYPEKYEEFIRGGYSKSSDLAKLTVCSVQIRCVCMYVWCGYVCAKKSNLIVQEIHTPPHFFLSLVGVYHFYTCFYKFLHVYSHKNFNTVLTINSIIYVSFYNFIFPFNIVCSFKPLCNMPLYGYTTIYIYISTKGKFSCLYFGV